MNLKIREAVICASMNIASANQLELLVVEKLIDLDPTSEKNWMLPTKKFKAILRSIKKRRRQEKEHDEAQLSLVIQKANRVVRASGRLERKLKAKEPLEPALAAYLLNLKQECENDHLLGPTTR